MAGMEPYHNVLCGGNLFLAVRGLGKCKTPAAAALAGADGSRDYYNGRIAFWVAVQPRLQRLGLSEYAGKFPRTDLSAFFLCVDSYKLGGNVALPNV